MDQKCYNHSKGMKQIILLLVATIFVAGNIARERIQLGNLFSRCTDVNLDAGSEAQSHRALRGNIDDSNTVENSENQEKEHTVNTDNRITLESNLLNLWNHIPEPNEQRPVQQLVLANFIPSPKTYPQDDVVMITHTSSNRYNNLLTQIQWWNGPTDVAVYIHKQDDIHRFTEFLLESEADLTTTTFHIVMEKTRLGYPHNVLRNLVLEHLKSDYFVAMDADFVTSPDAHGNLYSLIRNQEGLRARLQKKTIFVLPAFELLAPNGTNSPTEDMLPTSKDQVRERLQDGSMLPFHANWHGHTPTNYEKWISNVDHQADYPVTYQMYFEPYVLGYKHGMPRYWKHFRGFGYNKWSWFYEISKANYNFFVLQDFWVTHMNHPVTTRSNLKSVDANKPTFEKYEKYLNSFYGK
jgi:hypothetical protein